MALFTFPKSTFLILGVSQGAWKASAAKQPKGYITRPPGCFVAGTIFGTLLGANNASIVGEGLVVPGFSQYFGVATGLLRADGTHLCQRQWEEIG
jgi:hypothetical protein